MAQVYTKEEERVAAFRGVLSRYEIKMHASTVEGSNFLSDGHLLEDPFIVLITEGKNELSGTSKADPLLQAAAYYVAALKQLAKKRQMNGLFPCLITYYVGMGSWCLCNLGCV
jgi:hypothetical protein